MADVKWIKIVTDIFDDEKILLIESMPEADSVIVVWFKLLCLAGKQNNSGVFTMSNGIPYTDKMLATVFRRKETVVSMALNTFEQFGMIEIIDDAITIPKWGQHQNFDKIEAKTEYQREYMREYRERQKCIAEGKTDSKTNSKTNGKANVSSLDKIREERDKIREERDKINYQQIADMYNDTCVSFPRLTKLSETRKRAIKARLNTYAVEDFQRLFQLAEESSFLKGENEQNWSATFDWLLKDSNIAKVLDGNYNDRKDGKADADTGRQPIMLANEIARRLAAGEDFD